MRKLMISVVATSALVAGAASIGSASAAVPVDGAAIAKAASATLLVQEAYWRGRWWGYRGPGRRRGVCLNSPARC